MSFSSIFRRTFTSQSFASISHFLPGRTNRISVFQTYSHWPFHGRKVITQKSLYWQEVIRTSPSPTDASTIYEDPSKAAQRSMRAQNAEGLLKRKNFTQLRHEKKWMEQKKKKREIIFKNKKRGVDELRNYLRFKVDGDAMWKLQKSRSRAIDSRNDE